MKRRGLLKSEYPVLSLCLTLFAVAWGCPASDTSAPAVGLEKDASFGRRVFRPPPSDPVRAVPPHNIHRGGVGPYELSASLQETLALLPSGPRVELFEAKGLFDYRLMRSDGDALLIGVGRRGGVAFISVLDPDIARTESGVGVGAGLQELVGALGALRTPRNRGRDTRIVTFSALPDTRFIVERGKVAAAVVMAASAVGDSPRDADRAEFDDSKDTKNNSCPLAALEKRRDEFIALAKSETMGSGGVSPVSVTLGCLGAEKTGALLAGALLRRGDLVAWAVIDAGSPVLRVAARVNLPGLRFVTMLRTGGLHSKIFSVSERRSDTLREVVATRFAVSGSRLVQNWSKVAFSLKAQTAAWIGAQLQMADFLIEMNGRDGAVKVGGIYMERSHTGLRHVVPLTPVELPVSVPKKRLSVAESVRASTPEKMAGSKTRLNDGGSPKSRPGNTRSPSATRHQ